MSQNVAIKPSAQRVQAAIQAAGAEFEVIELAASARTAEDAAKALNCDVVQIVKSLIFKTKNTNQPVLVLVSGKNRVNEKKFKELLGEALSKADADFAREITGYAIGGIPPVGHKNTIEHIFIDQDLLEFDSVWAAAGTPHAVFNLNSDALLSLTNGKVISL